MVVRDIHIRLAAKAIARATSLRPEFVIHRTKLLAERIVEVAGDRDPHEITMILEDVAGYIVQLSNADHYINQACDMIDMVNASYLQESAASDSVGLPQVSRQPDKPKAPKVNRRPSAKTMPIKEEVAISQLGLGQETVDKLFDVGIGTSVQAIEYDLAKGLAILLGDDKALQVLSAIEQSQAPKGPEKQELAKV